MNNKSMMLKSRLRKKFWCKLISLGTFKSFAIFIEINARFCWFWENIWLLKEEFFGISESAVKLIDLIDENV